MHVGEQQQNRWVMPLTRARDNYLVGADGIRFLMRDGSFEIICEIERETLSQIGNASHADETVAIFHRHRAMIERAASDKYDRTSRRDYEIIGITAADLASGPCNPGFSRCDGT
jgi:hypothetical protein